MNASNASDDSNISKRRIHHAGVHEDLCRAGRLADRLAELVYRLIDDTEDLAFKAAPSGSVTAETQAKHRALRAAKKADDFLQKAAGQGIDPARVCMQFLSDGRAHVTMGDIEMGVLPQTPAVLLRVLRDAAARAQEAEDAWVGEGEIKRRLHKETGRPQSLRTIQQTVYRLRQALRDGGSNPWYVDHRPGAYRLIPAT